MIVFSVFVWIFAVIGFAFSIAIAVMCVKSALRVRKLKKLMREGSFVSRDPRKSDFVGYAYEVKDDE